MVGQREHVIRFRDLAIPPPSQNRVLLSGVHLAIVDHNGVTGATPMHNAWKQWAPRVGHSVDHDPYIMASHESPQAVQVGRQQRRSGHKGR